jgi:HAD superfamily hydrolase (TIGR01484 family)
MWYLVLACDYDGTVATHGVIDAETVKALERCLESGRKLVLVTGRELPELLEICPAISLFEWVVAENGSLLYRPATREERPLGSPPPAEFVQSLRDRGVSPLSTGRVIVATWEPHEKTVLATIRDFGLELQVIFNKGAVMILPSGINKATGLAEALEEIGVSPHNVVAVGDAENDHALLASCEVGVAVANATQPLKQRADFVTAKDHGAGVAEVVGRLLKDDLADLEPRLTRHCVLLGHDGREREFRLPAHQGNILVAGGSGGGKSTLATAFIERLVEAHYQVCIIDPEGDYEAFERAVVCGNADQPPTADNVLRLLEMSQEHVIANLIGVPIQDRPTQFLSLLTRLQELRTRTARPHWIVVDEAHHVLPSSWEPASLALPRQLQRTMFITLSPELLSPAALAAIDTLIAVGGAPEKIFEAFGSASGLSGPSVEPTQLEHGEMLVSSVASNRRPEKIKLMPGHSVRRRHSRKYAEGELEPDRSFYFRGREDKLNLRAQNLITFLQLAEGVDDETWLFHLQRGDYSKWFHEAIKDPKLADEAAKVEQTSDISAADSRRQIKEIVESRYTLPASPVTPVSSKMASSEERSRPQAENAAR